MFEARDVEDYLLALEEDRLLNIVACSSAKVWRDRPADTKTYPARAAYRGGMFKQAMQCFLDLKSRRGREPRWLILSAKYGLLEPDEEIADYNVSFAVKSDQGNVVDQVVLQRQWKEKQLDRYKVIFVWGGEAYANRVRHILKSSGMPEAKMLCPAVGLSIGRAMGVMKDFREALVPSLAKERLSKQNMERKVLTMGKKSVLQIGAGGKGSKYGSLKEYLGTCGKQTIELSFFEIEEILGFKLPSSAYRYSAWWSNEGSTHSHSLSWMEAGYETSGLSLLKKSITFKKTD